MDSLLSFPVGLFHPLQHAGLSRRSPSRRRKDGKRQLPVSLPGIFMPCQGIRGEPDLRLCGTVPNPLWRGAHRRFV